jgi:Tol biopolymer transport system component
MKTVPPTNLFQRRGLPGAGSLGVGSAAALVAVLLSGCSTIVKVESTPPGAAVTLAGQPLGVTPTQWEVKEPAKPVSVRFALPGYFPEEISYTAGNNPQPIVARLEPTKLEKSFDVASDPAGATVTLNGRQVGTTPVAVPVEFTRNSKEAPWIPQRVAVARANYETETAILTAELATVPVIRLSLLKDERTYAITATNLEGSALNAEVKLDGRPVGKTPLDLPITYQRADKTKPWPTFKIAVDVPGQYKVADADLTYPGATGIGLKLDAITEITAVIHAPEVAITPVGAALRFAERPTVATLRTGDDSTAITDLKQVTKYDRQDMTAANRIETISGFTLTPDGQNVIFALSAIDEAGSRYSNLHIKRGDDASGGISRLTTGARFFDSQPFINNDGGNYLVFTSNRGDRAKPDIFRVNLVENRLSGGISRLTNDNRFNYHPTYGDSNRQLFYLSVEPAFPKAEVQISSIRFDGSLPTQLPTVGEQINNTHAEKVFFVKVDSDTKKQQIYSITADGKLETALINQEDFKKANCVQPYVSPDGQRVLFVSDHTSDPRDRPNNDLYMINVDGTNLQRLTSNESDDTSPIWSPTEEGVVYFLSTRGGAPNIWRFKLVSGR